MDPSEPSHQSFSAESPLEMPPSECARLYEAILAASLSDAEKAIVRRSAAMLALSVAALAGEDARRLAGQWAPRLLASHLSAVSWPELWGHSPHLALRSEIFFLPSYRETFRGDFSAPLDKYAISLLQRNASLPDLLKISCFLDPRSLVGQAASHAERGVLLGTLPPIR